MAAFLQPAVLDPSLQVLFTIHNALCFSTQSKAELVISQMSTLKRISAFKYIYLVLYVQSRCMHHRSKYSSFSAWQSVLLQIEKCVRVGWENACYGSGIWLFHWFRSPHQNRNHASQSNSMPRCMTFFFLGQEDIQPFWSNLQSVLYWVDTEWCGWTAFMPSYVPHHVSVGKKGMLSFIWLCSLPTPSIPLHFEFV